MAFSPFSNSKAIREAKEAAGQQQAAAIYGMEAADAANARTIAGEAAAVNIFNAFGQEGTFEPGSGTGSYGEGQTNLFDPNAMPNQNLKSFGSYGGRKQLKTPRGGIIDPEGYANANIGTTAFKIRSKQTAEAYQLLNREGKEWDMLENSTLGQIHEGAALQLRDTLRQLKNNYAKGGTARRTAMNEMGEIQAAEFAHRMKTSETWQANIRLHDYIRKNADRVQAGNIEYVKTLPGLSTEYRAAYTATAALMVSASEKAAIIAGEAYEIRASQQARDIGGKLVEAVVLAAASSALSHSNEMFSAAGNYIQEWGDSNLGVTGGKFTDLLGGGVTAMGGDLSGLWGRADASPAGRLGGLTAAQKAAADASAGVDVNQAVLDEKTGVKNTTVAGPGSEFTQRYYDSIT
jgi:hypothetical protein